MMMQDPPDTPLVIQKYRFGQGFDWVKESWPWVKKYYGIILGALVIATILSSLANMVPVIGIIVGAIVSGALNGGNLLISHKVLTDQNPDIPDLFVCFKEYRDRLVRLVLLTLLPAVAILISIGIPILFLYITGQTDEIQTYIEQNSQTQTPPAALAFLFISVLLGLSFLLLAVLPAYYFAAPLIFFENYSIKDSLTVSFYAFWKNLWPLTAYSILAFGIIILGLLMLFVGVFFVLPLITVSYVYSYQKIFRTPQMALPSTTPDPE